MRRFIALVILVLGPLPGWADPAEISGSGNFTVGAKEPVLQSQFAALRAAGTKAIRLDVYPYNYYNGKKPVPEKSDSLVLAAHASGVKTIILLFEFTGKYRRLPDAPNHLGGYDKWNAIGKAFAERFSPSSAWLKSQGITDWGITLYEAFNEPDGEKKDDALPLTGPESYYDAVKGLADGVHAIDAKLAVIPGGFCRENSSSDHTLGGYGPALAPLWNDGTLDGIDLHTYNDIKWAAIVRPDGSVAYNFSPQAAFEAVKKACGITRDINFYTTEYNFKADIQGISEELAAKRLLTCIWANLGVVKNDGKTSATKLALIWNLFLTAEQDKFDGGCYGLAQQSDPWIPTPRGKTLQLVLTLTKEMEFTFLDPDHHGEYIMEGAGKKLWVWQNYEHWTDTPGSTFTVEGIPPGASNLEVIGWDGVRQTIPLSGQSSYTVTGLGSNETFMFMTGPDNGKGG